MAGIHTRGSHLTTARKPDTVILADSRGIYFLLVDWYSSLRHLFHILNWTRSVRGRFQTRSHSRTVHNVPQRSRNKQTMASFREEAQSEVPLVSEKHSGIPASLLDKARGIKKEWFAVRTKPLNDRKRLPVIPQGIEEAKFFEALDELRGDIGLDNVELNDKPLRDGW